MSYGLGEGRYFGSYDHGRTEAKITVVIAAMVTQRYFQLTGDLSHSIQMGAIAAKRWFIWYLATVIWWFFFIFGSTYVTQSSSATLGMIIRLAVSPMLSLVFIRNAHYGLGKARLMGFLWGWLAWPMEKVPTFILYLIVVLGVLFSVSLP